MGGELIVDDRCYKVLSQNGIKMKLEWTDTIISFEITLNKVNVIIGFGKMEHPKWIESRKKIAKNM